jgi:hypothetical protein
MTLPWIQQVTPNYLKDSAKDSTSAIHAHYKFLNIEGDQKRTSKEIRYEKCLTGSTGS